MGRKSYGKKRNYRKRRSRKRNRGSRISHGTIISKNPSPLGQMFRTKLRYYERGLQLNSTGGPANYIFAANGLYDPNITGIGHQPLGFDQLMLMYDHAVVIGSKITVTVENSDTTYSQILSLHVQDSTTPVTNQEIVIENGICNYTIIGNRDGGNSVKVLRKKVNPNKFLGRSKPLSDDQLKNSTSSNPAELCYYFLTTTPNSGTDVNILYFSVLIEYETVFIEPKQLAQS